MSVLAMQRQDRVGFHGTCSSEKCDRSCATVNLARGIIVVKIAVRLTLPWQKGLEELHGNLDQAG